MYRVSLFIQLFNKIRGFRLVFFINAFENDNGQAVLNPELLKDIPNLALVHIVLLRGSVVIEEIEGELYKFYAESHMRLPIHWSEI